MRMYLYRNGQSSELLVEALNFPVLNLPENNSRINESIVVPLAKELIEKQLQDAGLIR